MDSETDFLLVLNPVVFEGMKRTWYRKNTSKKFLQRTLLWPTCCKIVWGSRSHLSFTDITEKFPTLLTSYAVWVQHWSQTFLCCQWNGGNLQAIFQQFFWNYCIYKSDTAVAEQCHNQCIALTNLSDKIKLVNG